MKNSEKVKAAICSITNDMDMEQDNKFEVLEYLYAMYDMEKTRGRQEVIYIYGSENNN